VVITACALGLNVSVMVVVASVLVQIVVALLVPLVLLQYLQISVYAKVPTVAVELVVAAYLWVRELPVLIQHACVREVTALDLILIKLLRFYVCK